MPMALLCRTASKVQQLLQASAFPSLSMNALNQYGIVDKNIHPLIVREAIGMDFKQLVSHVNN